MIDCSDFWNTLLYTYTDIVWTRIVLVGKKIFYFHLIFHHQNQKSFFYLIFYHQNQKIATSTRNDFFLTIKTNTPYLYQVKWYSNIQTQYSWKMWYCEVNGCGHFSSRYRTKLLYTKKFFKFHSNRLKTHFLIQVTK